MMGAGVELFVTKSDISRQTYSVLKLGFLIVVIAYFVLLCFVLCLLVAIFSIDLFTLYYIISCEMIRCL